MDSLHSFKIDINRTLKKISFQGTREIFNIHRRVCLFRNKIYVHNDTYVPDPCTNCRCKVRK